MPALHKSEHCGRSELNASPTCAFTRSPIMFCIFTLETIYLSSSEHHGRRKCLLSSSDAMARVHSTFGHLIMVINGAPQHIDLWP